MKLEDQIYVVTAVLGSGWILLSICIFILFLQMSKLRKLLFRPEDYSRKRSVGSEDLLERRGFNEYKGVEKIQSPPRLPLRHENLSRQVSSVGHSSYQPEGSSFVGKPPSSAGYGRSYDNHAFTRDQRDLPPGGVRVLPSVSTIDNRRSGSYEKGGYY